jgi:hypothetical protein
MKEQSPQIELDEELIETLAVICSVARYNVRKFLFGRYRNTELSDAPENIEMVKNAIRRLAEIINTEGPSLPETEIVILLYGMCLNGVLNAPYADYRPLKSSMRNLAQKMPYEDEIGLRIVVSIFSSILGYIKYYRKQTRGSVKEPIEYTNRVIKLADEIKFE